MDGETGGLQSWGHKESETTERLSIAPKTSVCYRLRLAPQVALVVKNKPASAGDVRNVGSIPGSEKSPGEGHGNPLQSCLENSHGHRSLVVYGP